MVSSLSSGRHRPDRSDSVPRTTCRGRPRGLRALGGGPSVDSTRRLGRAWPVALTGPAGRPRPGWPLSSSPKACSGPRGCWLHRCRVPLWQTRPAPCAGAVGRSAGGNPLPPALAFVSTDHSINCRYTTQSRKSPGASRLNPVALVRSIRKNPRYRLLRPPIAPSSCPRMSYAMAGLLAAASGSP